LTGKVQKKKEPLDGEASAISVFSPNPLNLLKGGGMGSEEVKESQERWKGVNLQKKRELRSDAHFSSEEKPRNGGEA